MFEGNKVMNKYVSRNRPLPNHTNLDYYECLAKIALERIFPEEFSGLLIVDRPDLQNKEMDIGIEVTRAINSDQETVDNLYNKIKIGQVRDSNGVEKCISDIYKRNGMNYLNEYYKRFPKEKFGFHHGIPGSDNLNRVLDAWYNKLKNLNSDGFKRFCRNYLFVYSDISIIVTMLDQAISKMKSDQVGFDSVFDKVYIYVPECIYILDLENCISKNINIKNIQFDIAIAAREMVIAGE